MEKSVRMTALRKTMCFVTAIVLSSIVVGCANPMASSSSKSANANLATLSLSVSGTAVTISPAFSADTATYVATVSNATDSVTISASAAESAAVVTGTGAKSLVVGANTASVTVTAPDGSTTKTYTITITKAEHVASTISITSPIVNSTVSTPTISVTGSYKGDNAPSSITVYLGLSKTVATIDSTTQTWSAEVTPTGVAKTESVSAKVVGAWDSSIVTEYRSFGWSGTSDLGHTVSGTIAFPWKSLTSDTDLFVFTVDPVSDNSIAVYNAKLGSSTSFFYTLKNVADGAYKISAYTHSGDWSYVQGTSCYQWGVINITVKGGDVTGQDFALLSPSGTAAKTVSGTITLPSNATFASTSCIAVLLKPSSSDTVVSSVNIPITSARDYPYSLSVPSGTYTIQGYVNDGTWVWKTAELYANWSGATFTVGSENVSVPDFALSKSE